MIVGQNTLTAGTSSEWRVTSKSQNKKNTKRSKAIVLLSGGVDSSTLLYWAKRKYQCVALTFDYGQKHKKEIASAKKIAQTAQCPWMHIPLKFPHLRSSLTSHALHIPDGRKNYDQKKSIPSTYVPGRNTFFLSYALSIAESDGINFIFIGANAVDFSGYPDCRPDYIRAFENVARLGTKAGREGNPIRVQAPLINKTKAEIIRLGLRLGVPYGLTWSCYRGGKKPCGRCEACIIRERGFKEVKVLNTKH